MHQHPENNMLVVLVLLAWPVQTTLGQCLSPQDNRFHKDPAAHRELLRSQLDFSINLFRKVGTTQPSDNVFISPLSIYNALLLAYFTSKAQTEESLRKTLFLPANQDKLDMLFSYRLQKHRSAAGAYKSQVNTANRLFISVNQTVRDCMEEYFDDEIESLDFSEKGLSQAAERINNWVANLTHNNILDLVSADSLSPGTQLILANAAYFKGVWANQFDPRDTKIGNFTVNNKKSVPTPLMFQLNNFNHWRSDRLGAQVLELPYKGGEISLILMLPDSSNSTSPTTDLLRKLDSSTLINIISESISDKNEDKVEVRIPKFKVERTLELTPILESLGVGDLFQPTSDLTGLTGGPRINLNSAIHKAKMQVDERGTEAAAATALVDTRIPGNSFICDRPFVYLLYDKALTTLLFAGVLNDPSK